MGKRPIIRFIHEGKAAYPDVRAYADYFGAAYDTTECTPREAANASRLDETICWHMMGFYPRRLPCAITVHDYRSLSVGHFRQLKDKSKRLLNARPNIQIFQNDAIRGTLGFPLTDHTIFLPMGVPKIFIEQRRLSVRPLADFIYIGSMLPERRCELMLDSFVRRFGSSRTFDLYGPPNPELEARYAAHGSVRFHGLVAQERLPAILKGARVGVCYFPMHYPHVLQTPTKLMEYAAIGMQILANDHPQSRLTAKQYGLNCLWADMHDMFARLPDGLAWADNQAIDAEPMAWPSVIAASGIDQALRQSLEQSRESLG